MTNRLLAAASLAAAVVSAAAAFAAPRAAHSHGAHGHRHAHVQEAGGKPAPLAAPQRQHLDANRCPAGSAFNVTNRGSVPIVQVYLRPSATTGGFNEERLRGRVLQPGQWLALEPGVGRFDVLVVRADGTGSVAMRQDPCRISEVALRQDASFAIR